MNASERETILATVGLSLCAWVILTIVAWTVRQMLDANKAANLVECVEVRG